MNTTTTSNTTGATITEAQVDEMARRLVSQDVRYCVSALVSALMKGAFQDGAIMDEEAATALSMRAPNADDYSDAARYDDEGKGITVWQDADADGAFWRWTYYPAGADMPDGMESGDASTALEAWVDAFEAAGMDAPDGSEVFEHWLVTDDLARRLKEQGEAIADDVEGMTIWGRSTTGQAIYSDGVIRDIARTILTA